MRVPEGDDTSALHDVWEPFPRAHPLGERLARVTLPIKDGGDA